MLSIFGVLIDIKSLIQEETLLSPFHCFQSFDRNRLVYTGGWFYTRTDWLLGDWPYTLESASATLSLQFLPDGLACLPTELGIRMGSLIKFARHPPSIKKIGGYLFTTKLLSTIT